MPFFIPFLISAISAASAAHGVKKGIDAKHDFDAAKETSSKASALTDAANKRMNTSNDNAMATLNRLAEIKVRISVGSMHDFVENYKRIKNVKHTDAISDEELKDYLSEFESMIPEIKSGSVEARDLAMSTATSVAMGSLISTGTKSLVLGAVTKGGLAGAAASNHALAVLGGGAKAAGGLGMAGGKMVLKGLGIGSAISLGGSLLASKAQTKLNEAQSEYEQAKVLDEYATNTCIILDTINDRATQFCGVLTILEHFFEESIQTMCGILDRHGVDFRAYSLQDQQAICATGTLAKTINTILKTTLLDDEGELNPGSEEDLLKGQQYAAQLEAPAMTKAFDAAKDDRSALLQLNKDLTETGYQKNTVETWQPKITEQLLYLDEREVSLRLEQSNGDYDALLQLYQDLKNGTYSAGLFDKLRNDLDKQLMSAQQTALDALCSDMSQKSYEALLKLKETAQKRYVYNEPILLSAVSAIEAAATEAETREISALLASCEGSAEALTAQREALKKSPYSSKARKHWDKLFADSILEAHDKTLNAQHEACKDDLQALRQLRTSICEGDYSKALSQKWCDRITDQVLALESEEVAAKFKEHENDRIVLRQLLCDLPNHEYDEQTVKKWTSQLNTGISILDHRYFTQQLEQNKFNYAALLELAEELNTGDYSAKLREKFSAPLHEQTIAAQKAALDALCSGKNTMERLELLELKQQAQDRFTYDADTLQSCLNALDDSIDKLETAKIEELVKGSTGQSVQWYEQRIRQVQELGFDSSKIAPCLKLLKNKLADAKLAEQVQAAGEDLPALQKLLRDLNKCEYPKQIITQWEGTIIEKIISLEDRQFAQQLEQHKNDYSALLALRGDLSSLNTAVIEKWNTPLHEAISAAQKVALDTLLVNLDSMERQELLDLKQIAENQFDYNADVLQPYVSAIQTAILDVEKRTLDALVSGIEDQTSAQYEALVQKITDLDYNKAGKKPYLKLLDKKIADARLAESYNDEYLDDCSIEELEACRKAIDNTDLSPQKKAALNQRFDQYADRIRNCEDRATVQLLRQCEPDNISELDVPKLRELLEQIQAHKLLPDETKQSITDRLNTMKRVKTLENLFDLAKEKNDYDGYVSLLAKVSEVNLPQQHTDRFTEELHKCITEKQSEILSDLLAQKQKYSISQLQKTITKASHYNFSEEVLAQCLQELEACLSEKEHQALDKVCSGLSDCTLDELTDMETAIKKTGSREATCAPYLQKLQARTDELVFAELTEQCTQVSLMRSSATLSALATLLEQLKANPAGDKACAYIQRIETFMELKKKYQKEVSSIHQQLFDKAQSYAVSGIGGAIPQYSSLRSQCVFDPGSLDAMCDRLNCFNFQDLEQPLFVFEDHPGTSTFRTGICLTDVAVYSKMEHTTARLPLNDIQEVKTSMILSSISFVGTFQTLKFPCSVDGYTRTVLATALWNLVQTAKNGRNTFTKDVDALDASYRQQYMRCFAENPIEKDEEYTSPSSNGITVSDVQTDMSDINVTAPLPTAPASAPTSSQTATNQPSDTSTEQLIEKGLKNFKRPISDPTDAGDLSAAIHAMLRKHSVHRYLTVAHAAFEKKAPKAVKAYAHISPEEWPILMEDHTVFESAKEGFFLSNLKLYLNSMGYRHKCVDIGSLTSVDTSRSLGLTDVFLLAPGIKLRVTYRSSDDEAQACAAFWKELLSRVNGNCTTPDVTTPAPSVSAPQPTAPAPAAQAWQCSCGCTNTGKFCSDCGQPRAIPNPQWTCSCGAENTGRFCRNCGAPKPTI